MNEKLGFFHMLIEGGVVIQLTAFILFLMSIASWTVIIVKAHGIQGAKKQAQSLKDFWHSRDLEQGIQKLAGAGNPDKNAFEHLVREGQYAIAHHRHTDAHLHDSLDLSDWITGTLKNAIDDTQEKLGAGLALLASIGSTAPFIGLFGTVWGIYHALLGIGELGQVSIDRVAGPVGEALIMTALGLFVAIPAVLGYNALVRGNKFILGKLNRFAYELHAYYMTGQKTIYTHQR